MRQHINRRDFLKQGALAAGAVSLSGLPLNACRQRPPEAQPVATPTLWQLPQTGNQAMGYVLKTPADEILVIDGGWTHDAPYLLDFINKISDGGNLVHAWILTHPHLDHVDAFTAICNEQPRLRVGVIHASLPEQAWVDKHHDAWDEASVQTLASLNAAIAKTGQRVAELTPGQQLHFRDLEIEILAIRNPEITRNAVNNQSVVFRLKGPNKSVLFLGDLGVEGGKTLLSSPFRDRLPADYVQMAHHGQNGVGREVYEAIGAKGCLWPTPGWLWDNDNGGGVNSGQWQTLKVRAWMDELGVQEHIVAKDGLGRITL